MDAARSAYAAGTPQVQEDLANRRFSIRQAFGCGVTPPAQAEEGVARWAFRPRQETIEVSLTPADWTEAPFMAADAGNWELVEGFWLTYPWLRTGDCPAIPEPEPTAEPETAPAATPLRTDGLAAVFARESSRVGRRAGKAYSFTIRGDGPVQPPSAGYRLVVEGRFAAFANGRAIHCHSPSPDRRPVCVAAAEVDRVAFEDADGKVLQEWRRG